MRSWLAILTVVSAFGLAGCGPRITALDPDPATELQMVKVEGNRMTGAVIYVDGVPVGAAIVPALSDPLKRRDVVVPDGVAPSGSFQARDAIATSTTLTIPVLAAAPAVPNFVILGATGTAATGVNFVINGDGVYPGANVPLSEPFKGPTAWAVPTGGGPAVPATGTTFLWERTFQISFDAGVLTPGTYKIRIQNDAAYGGLGPADSTNTQAVS